MENEVVSQPVENLVPDKSGQSKFLIVSIIVHALFLPVLIGMLYHVISGLITGQIIYSGSITSFSYIETPRIDLWWLFILVFLMLIEVIIWQRNSYKILAKFVAGVSYIYSAYMALTIGFVVLTAFPIFYGNDGYYVAISFFGPIATSILLYATVQEFKKEKILAGRYIAIFAALTTAIFLMIALRPQLY